MIGNPLIPSKDSAETAKQERAEHSVRLISNKPPQAIEGLEEFLAVFNTREVDAVITPFRHVIQRKVRRNMGGKFGQGLSHEVVENVEINPNEDLIALRRWMGAVRQDPANIMLLQIAKVKEEPLAAPLVFSEQIKAGRPILITGADSSARDQLLSAVDLKFSVTPDLVDQNHALKTMILGRSQRRKGFMASMRNLMELDFLPQGLLDKITQISTGADTAGMADPEIINLILLSDLVSRYQGVLGQYKEVLANQTLQVTQLKNLFEMITVDIPADKIIEAFRDMVDTERVELAAVTTKGTLFAHAYQYITGEESKKDRVNRKDVFFKRLFSLILRYRSQIDPKLWNRCYFLANADPVEKAIYQGTRPYHQLLTKSMERMEGLEETTPVDPILVEQTGRQLFGLIRLANQDPVKMREPAEFARQRLANRLLPLFSVAYFNTEDFVYHGQVKKGLPEKPEIFLQAFKKVKITLGELKRIAGNLGPLLFYNEMVSGEVRKATLTVISTHKKEMEQDLHKVFAQSAHEMLPYFTFHLDQKKLSPVERLGAAETLTRRLGLEVHPNPTTRSSIGLFTEATPPPGKLQNPPLVLARTYQWLLSRQIEEATRNLTARKLNYLVKTWENRFFEWVYHHVAHRQGLAVSRRQFVEVMRERGPLKNLDEKNLDPETWDDSLDPFFPMAQPVSETDGASPPPQGGALAPYPDFEAGYNRIHTRFRQLLNNYKTAAEENPAPLNPARQIWSMISKGICDMTGEAAALAFEESVFHNTLQNLVFAISSDNHAEFHPDTGGLALTLHLPVRWAPLQWVGDRFQFLDGDRMVVFLFSPLPAGEEETMDEPSRLFMEKLQEALDDPESGPQQALKALCFELASYQEQWIEYSRYLSVALLDNAVTEGVVKMSLPPPVLPKHLWYLPDASKLCMGKPVRASESISFTRVLRQPDLLGSVSKNPKVLSTTIDEFAVDSYNISKLRDDLVFIRDICGDVWDGLKTISYSVADGPLVERYTKNMRNFQRLLSRPLRAVSETDIQALHVLAVGAKDLVAQMQEVPGLSRDKAVNRLMDFLTLYRNDGAGLKLTFTDVFILPTSDVKVKKVEGVLGQMAHTQTVEVDSGHQTLASRFREFIQLRGVLNRKSIVVFQPEGQRKKQLDYTLHIAENLLSLRGSAVQFYLDRTLCPPDALVTLAGRIRPHCFYKEDSLTPEPLPGMKVAAGPSNPLTGLPVNPVISMPSPAATAQPQPPQAPAQSSASPGAPKTIGFSSADGSVKYVFDPVAQKFALTTPEGMVAARPLAVPLPGGAKGYVLLARLHNGKAAFHGLFNKTILLPQPEPASPPILAAFDFGGQAVLLVNADGKPAVKLG